MSTTITEPDEGRAEPPPGDGLTNRQREILELLASGASTKQVARRLGLSARTIDKHMEMAYRTLRVTTRIQALRALGHLTPGSD